MKWPPHTDEDLPMKLYQSIGLDPTAIELIKKIPFAKVEWFGDSPLLIGDSIALDWSNEEAVNRSRCPEEGYEEDEVPTAVTLSGCLVPFTLSTRADEQVIVIDAVEGKIQVLLPCDLHPIDDMLRNTL